MNFIGAIHTVSNRLKPLKQVISDSWSERELILKSDVNLYCWKRTVNPDISTYLSKLITKELKPISFFTSVSDLPVKLAEYKKAWDGHGGNQQGSDAFWEDVGEISRDFIASCSKEKTGTVRLKLVKGNECTKYHTDGYPLRLFTTYYGAGTEWLPEKAVDRTALGKPNAQVLRDPTLVQQMKTFEVGILKGEFHKRTNRSRGIVHRSPEIEKAGEKRIILRIDI